MRCAEEIERLFNADDHGVRPGQRFCADNRKSGFFEPLCTFGTCKIESSWRFKQHVETHHESEGILRSVVIYDGFIHDECAPRRDGVECFLNEHFLRWQVPVVQNMPINTTSALGRSLVKKLPGIKSSRSLTPEARAYCWKTGPTSGRSNPIPRK